MLGIMRKVSESYRESRVNEPPALKIIPSSVEMWRTSIKLVHKNIATFTLAYKKNAHDSYNKNRNSFTLSC